MEDKFDLLSRNQKQAGWSAPKVHSSGMSQEFFLERVSSITGVPKETVSDIAEAVLCMIDPKR